MRRQMLRAIRRIRGKLCGWICPRCEARAERPLMQARLEGQRKEIVQLHSRLKQTRADKHRLQKRFSSLPDGFAAILGKSTALLQGESKFDIRITEDGAGWEVVTGYCCFGGCDMGVYLFPSERDALLFSALLTAIDYKAPHNMACSPCYAEYMKDCI